MTAYGCYRKVIFCCAATGAEEIALTTFVTSVSFAVRGFRFAGASWSTRCTVDADTVNPSCVSAEAIADAECFLFSSRRSGSLWRSADVRLMLWSPMSSPRECRSLTASNADPMFCWFKFGSFIIYIQLLRL